MTKGERNKDISDKQQGEITKKLVHGRETKDISVLRCLTDNKGGEFNIGGEI